MIRSDYEKLDGKHNKQVWCLASRNDRFSEQLILLSMRNYARNITKYIQLLSVLSP